jgi:hypothetical protein
MVLFDLATARLVKEKILLPGVTTLTRSSPVLGIARQLDYGESWPDSRVPSNAEGCSRCCNSVRAGTDFLFWTEGAYQRLTHAPPPP